MAVTDVRVSGVGMTPFGRHPAETVPSLARAATQAAMADAGVTPEQVDAVFFANAVGGLTTGQEMIRGQAALRGLGLFRAPLVNVENACASGSSALALAVAAVASGRVGVALAVGAERLTIPDRAAALAAIGSAVDLTERDAVARWAESVLDLDPTESSARSLFMDLYAARGRLYANRSGATDEDLARVVVKSRRHAADNPLAQFRSVTTVEEVLSARRIVPGLTLPMCSPTGDGAAAVVVTAPGTTPHDRARVLACELATGFADPELTAREGSAIQRAAAAAYRTAGIGPGDLDVVELHDAAAPAELMAYEELGLCAFSAGPELLRSGNTALGGSCPVNVSGGLLSRGHPIGATGLAQVVELVDQLAGRAGDRQVVGARLALAENSGGWIGGDAAATVITILGAGTGRAA